MKVLGLIAEYNPFHYGHKYHLNESLKKTNSNYSIALMSGSFVQRGMPSFVDKWTKAKMAIDNGIDLVIELPALYSCQSAELFALGAIKILNSMNIVDCISFGSEEGDLNPLKTISQIFLDEPETFKESLNYYLSLGNSFPVSRSLALQDYIKNNKLLKKSDIQSMVKKSNNILGIEYLKALSTTNSAIEPYTIKRIGSEYKDINPHSEFSSATAIRNTIVNEGLSAGKSLIPLNTFNLLKDYLSKYGHFNDLENYKDIIRYLFLTKDIKALKNIRDIEEGLENRIINYIKTTNNLEDTIGHISTRRYPSTRIQRIFMHLLLDLDKSLIKESYLGDPEYIRVLASNKKGLFLLNKIKKESPVKIISKFSNYKKYNINKINTFLEFEKKATDIYFLGLGLKKPLTDMDYYTSPYIK